MKTKLLTLISAAMLSTTLFAADYSSMGTEELKTMRGKVAPEDRAAFQTEMQKRTSQMTPEERDSMRKSQSGMQKGSGMGAGQGQGMGRNR